MTPSYNYVRALPLVAVTALVMYGSLQCLYRKENNHNQEEVPQTPIIFAPPRGINQTTLEADIRQCIDIPTSVNLTNEMLNVIDIPTMIRKHEMNKRKSINSGMKPLLIIIDPGLFFDVKPVNISEQKASNKSSLSNIICAFNQNTLRFSLRSDNSGSDNIYLYRQDLMVFISWMHRLEQNFKIPIEIIAYSETLRLNELLFHINLIQIYYNSVALSNTNSDEWFKFIAAITSRPHSKLYQG